MLQNGQINAQDAGRLLEALGSDSDKPRTASGAASRKLRVKVKGETEPGKPINVDVVVPTSLARAVDNILANCIPAVAHDEMLKQGINIRELRIGEIMDTLESLDEDIVNVDLDSGGADLKVRVYVE